jgi:hypothetical protein
MSTYELINKLEKLDYFNDLLKSGLVPLNWLDYKLIYEFYKEERKKDQLKKQALTNTADEFNVSERTVYLIIQKMKG